MRTALLFAFLCCAPPLFADDAICVNLDPAEFSNIFQSAGLTGVRSSTDRENYQGRVVIWQMHGPIKDSVAKTLSRFVQNGGSLLISFDSDPGPGARRLGFMLPTMAWSTWPQAIRREEATIKEPDPAFFPDPGAVKNFRVPFHYEIRPWHAVERGQARYDRYLRDAPYPADTPGAQVEKLPAGSNWWTRPLLNRDWQIRARCDDYAQTPLLLTGRYGGGKVAVFGSRIQGGADAGAFWTPVLRWLCDGKSSAPLAASSSLKMDIIPKDSASGVSAPRSVVVRITNQGAQNAAVLVLARILTWENAPVGDVERNVTVPAGASILVSLPMPAPPDATSYQALDALDEYHLRLGLLSADGCVLLSEQEANIDLRPVVLVDVHTTEVRETPRPFKEPVVAKDVRASFPIYSYAYKTGQTASGEVVLENGIRNLAPMAAVSDESQPGNPSLSALNDKAARAEAKPDWYAQDAWGYYEGAANRENILAFKFPRPVTVNAVTLAGAVDNYRNYLWFNPHGIIIEADGKAVAREEDADERFPKEGGMVRLAFPAVTATTIRVRLAAFEKAPRLVEVFIDGVDGHLPVPAKGALSLGLRNALTNEITPVLKRDVTLQPLERLSVPFSAPLPDKDGASIYRLETEFDGQTGDFPVLALKNPKPLAPVSDLVPSDQTAVSFNFIVTNGFCNLFDNGTGTHERHGSWGQPDDLIWCYERGLKQNSDRTRTRANRLYVTENDMCHYSTPWRAFYNQERVFSVAAPLLVETAKKLPNWSKSNAVNFFFSDRWDSGPSITTMYSWSDFEAFNRYLKAHGQRGLTGKTRSELSAEIRNQYSGLFNAWQLEAYEGDVISLRDAFTKAGKQLTISAQGTPLVPPEHAKIIGEVVRGMNDDSTWGMADDSIPLTTGRQMGILAFNPFLKIKEQDPWGWDDALLGNVQWRGPVGTTEPSRRHLYDRAFRGMIHPDGSYGSMHASGYGLNDAIAYTMGVNDYNEWQRTEERHSLLTPDAPLGAGIILSTAYMRDLNQLRISGGGMGGSEAEEVPMVVASLVQRLHQNGLSVPFSGNVALLDKWQGNAPLILANIDQFGDDEIAALKKLAQRGVKIAAFADPGRQLSDACAALFGVTRDGKTAAGKQIGLLAGRPITALETRLFVSIDKRRLGVREAQEIAPILQKQLEIPLVFPAGTAGYGFKSNGRTFVVVEDWREAGRVENIRIRAQSGAVIARAASVNDHTNLKVTRDQDWWVIAVPLRPGDAQLVCLEETK